MHPDSEPGRQFFASKMTFRLIEEKLCKVTSLRTSDLIKCLNFLSVNFRGLCIKSVEPRKDRDELEPESVLGLFCKSFWPMKDYIKCSVPIFEKC